MQYRVTLGNGCGFWQVQSKKPITWKDLFYPFNDWRTVCDMLSTEAEANEICDALIRTRGGTRWTPKS
jgi:hypothetical protein